MDVWGPARVSGQGRERYFLLVVDDYTRYTTVFPLRSNVSPVLNPWIRTVRLQLRERFGRDLPVLRLHSNRGGEFSSDILRDFCRGEGIRQSFTLSDSPQQNGIAEHRIGLVMEVARISMIHAATPHFLWPFAVRYAAHQLNLWPRVSVTETSPTLRWTGKFGNASVFRFYHPTSRHVLLSQDVTFDESVPFYCLFPYRSAPPLPPPLFLAPAPVQVAVVSGAAPGAASEGAEPGGAGSEGAGFGGAELEGVEPGGAESEGAEPGAGAVDPGGAGDTVRPRPYFVPLLQQVPGVPCSTGLPPPFLCPPPDKSQPPLQPASPLPVPSPYTEQSGGLTERREPASRPVSPVRTARRTPCSRPPPVTTSHRARYEAGCGLGTGLRGLGGRGAKQEG
ncbi:unnamed protein product [Closterium sp. NIES-53]